MIGKVQGALIKSVQWFQHQSPPKPIHTCKANTHICSLPSDTRILACEAIPIMKLKLSQVTWKGLQLNVYILFFSLFFSFKYRSGLSRLSDIVVSSRSRPSQGLLSRRIMAESLSSSSSLSSWIKPKVNSLNDLANFFE